MVVYGDIVKFPAISPVGVGINEAKNELSVVFINRLLADYGDIIQFSTIL